jgi:hypothetical protein
MWMMKQRATFRYASIGSERWLGFLLEIIGALIQFFAAIFAIEGKTLTSGEAKFWIQ